MKVFNANYRCGLYGSSIIVFRKSRSFVCWHLLAMNTVDAHAHRPSTLHARSHTATEQVISWWRARLWRNSIDCQHVIEVLLSLRAMITEQIDIDF